MDWLHAREPVSAWTHGGWLLLCLPAVVLLHRRAGFSLVKQLGLALYSLGLALCFMLGRQCFLAGLLGIFAELLKLHHLRSPLLPPAQITVSAFQQLAR